MVNGCSVNSLPAKLVPNNYQYSKGTFRKFTTEQGVSMDVDISDYVGHYLYFGFKDEGHQKLYGLVKEGMKILDIGTNIGSTLLHFAKLTGDAGFVYGFEPDTINYKACLKNLSLNDFKNIKVSNIGLGDENNEYDLYEDSDGNRGGNRISFDQNNNKRKSRITVEKLDHWSDKNQVENIDLIKIDIEGFEYKALMGGEGLIRKNMPILFIELDDNNLKNVGDSALGLVKLLENWGYSIKNSLNNESVSSKTDFTDCHYDIIAKYSEKINR
ncbi:MAG: FkbM family methyltransferase [Brumimicrobium sp.]